MSDLDDLMDKDVLSLTTEDIDNIIAYHRKNRDAGPRPKKEAGPQAKINITTLGLKAAVPAPTIKRRF